MKRRTLIAAAVASAGTACAAAQERPRLNLELKEGVLWVRDGDRPVLAYRHAPVQGPAGTDPLFTRSAYLHPVHAPNGALVTDDFSPDHPHQRGVFFAWTRTRIRDGNTELEPDFWNLGAGTARIRSEKVSGRAENTRPVRFTAQHVWEFRSGNAWKRALDETWEVSVLQPEWTDPQAPGSAYVIDLTSRQRPLVDLELPEYRYGGMAVRGPRPWVDKTAGMIVLTSDGKDRAGAEGAKPRWVDMSGPIHGKQAGIALLEHPSTPRAPNPVRMHPDVPYYVFAPSKAGRLVLDAGREHVFRYRIAAHNGRADAAALNALWERFR
jgi:hypothetical protein